MADAGALEALVARLERVASLLEGRLETSPALAKKPDVSSRSISALDLVKENAKVDSADGAISPSVAAFDELLKTKLTRVKAAAVKIGGSVLKATEVLESAFAAERNIVLAFSQCKVSELIQLIKLFTLQDSEGNCKF